MKSIFKSVGAMCIAAMMLTGCTKTTDVGGSGASPKDGGYSEKERANTEDTFTLSLPSDDVDVTQGETVEFTIDLNAESDFNDTVEVALTAAADGVTVSPEKVVLSKDTTSVNIKLTASDSAPVGVTTVSILGKPTRGESVSSSVKVDIAEKDRP